MHLVSPSAAENPAWKSLLEYLGVTICSKNDIVKRIHKRYSIGNANAIELPNAVNHIRFLFWADSEKEPSWNEQIRLMNHFGSMLKPHEYLYFPTRENDYSPSELFKQSAQLPGLPVHYLNNDYLEAVKLKSVNNGVSYLQWLEFAAGVCRVVKLQARSSDQLSYEFRYIIDFRSDKLLGVLKHNWVYYQKMSPKLEEELRKSNVLLENGFKMQLRFTHLPLPELRRITDKLEITENFPFVSTTEPLRDEQLLDWVFLKRFQVGIDADLSFYICALETFKRAYADPNSASLEKALKEIYSKLQSLCTEDQDRVRYVYLKNKNSVIKLIRL